VREIEFFAPARVTILSERRRYAPYGLAGGQPGQTGCNTLIPASGAPAQGLPGKASFDVEPGDALRIETPGGGGWGEP
jgi:N-methylhydantoinase B